MEKRNKLTPEALAKIKTMSKSGDHCDNIAEYLNEEGFTTKTGKPFSQPTVSEVLLANGVRRVEKYHRKPRKPPPQAASAIKPITTKWQVLQAIEDCSDISEKSKKSLLDLVWGELHK